MFASSSGSFNDPSGSCTGGFKKISILGNPMTSIWFVGTFFKSFISYQLETWQMLADTHNQIRATSMNPRQGGGRGGGGADRYGTEDEKSYITNTNFNSIINRTQHPLRSTKDFNDLLAMRIGFTDDTNNNKQQASIRVPASQHLIKHSSTWRPEHSNCNDERASSSKSPALLPHNFHLEAQNLSSSNKSQPFDQAHFFEQHRAHQLKTNPKFRGVQGQDFANFRPHTSMDERSEFSVARRQQFMSADPTFSSQGPSNLLTCHRRRNASYSSARMSSKISNLQLESSYFRPSTGTLMVANSFRPTLMGNCSPLSSGSLPTSLQHCNWNSQTDSLDYSVGEPISLPLTDTKPQQVPSSSQLSRTSEFHTQQKQQQDATHYRWQCGNYDLNTNNANIDKRVNKTVFGRQTFKQSMDNCPNGLKVGSDSELYSRNQRAAKQNQNYAVTTRRSELVNQASVTNHQPISRFAHRNTSDNYRTIASSNPTPMSSMQQTTNITTTTNNRAQTADNGLLAKKATSSNNKLSLSGARRRLGFKQKGLVSLSIQRCEEVAPQTSRHFISQMTTSSFADSGTESVSNWTSQQQIQQSVPLDPRIKFVEGLGIGQITSRQALVSPYLGDIQLTLSDRRGMLEVEVVRARGLQLKPGAKTLPSPYVKLYLMKNKKCLAKSKTLPVRRTLDPLYQQQFIFREDYTNCILQVIVWGDYGKKDRKSLMGIVQIRIDDLDMDNLVIDWYRMFNAPSMTHSLVSSRALRQMILSKTVDVD